MPWKGLWICKSIVTAWLRSRQSEEDQRPCEASMRQIKAKRVCGLGYHETNRTQCVFSQSLHKTNRAQHEDHEINGTRWEIVPWVKTLYLTSRQHASQAQLLTFTQCSLEQSRKSLVCSVGWFLSSEVIFILLSSAWIMWMLFWGREIWSLVLLKAVVWSSLKPYRGTVSIMCGIYPCSGPPAKQHNWFNSSHCFKFPVGKERVTVTDM